MAASGVTDELTALEQARSRLETALGSDENWRALQQAPGQGDDADASAARRARNTRLKMALAENPLYQAWKHLGEAIDALRKSAAEAERAAASGELPEEIARLLRSHASEEAPPVADEPVEPPDESELGTRPIEPPVAPATAGKTMVDVDAAPSPHPNGRAVADQEEATVSFVRREPLLPSAQLPADLGTERASVLFERLRGLGEHSGPAATTAAFARPSDGAEEAEVSIVSAEGARERREAEERAGTIRRLRKALSGD